MLIDLWGERQDKGFGIEQQILKARQQGISTEVELAILHLTNFGMGVKAAIASYDQDACERMWGMYQLAYNEMPLWMKSNLTTQRASSLIAFGGAEIRRHCRGHSVAVHGPARQSGRDDDQPSL
jgi:hypothetical protein